MQIHRYGYGDQRVWPILGFGLRFLAMVSEKAQYRYGVLRFWEKYGLAPTLEAFEIKRRTVYHWRAQLRTGGEDLEALNEKPKAPRRRRKRLSPKEVTEEIRRLRTLYPNLSKEKLDPAMTLTG